MIKADIKNKTKSHEEKKEENKNSRDGREGESMKQEIL